MVLVGEHGVVRKAQLLRPLDLGIPVRTFDQAAHQAHAVLARQRRDVFDQLQRAGLVGLHGQSESTPLRMVLRHLGQQHLQHLQGELQAVHFLGVNGEVDVGPRCLLAQAPDPGHQLQQHTLALCLFIARVQGAELDADAVIVLG